MEKTGRQSFTACRMRKASKSAGTSPMRPKRKPRPPSQKRLLKKISRKLELPSFPQGQAKASTDICGNYASDAARMSSSSSTPDRLSLFFMTRRFSKKHSHSRISLSATRWSASSYRPYLVTRTTNFSKGDFVRSLKRSGRKEALSTKHQKIGTIVPIFLNRGKYQFLW